MNTACSSSSLILPLFYKVPVAGNKGNVWRAEYQRQCFVLPWHLSPASTLACLCIFLMQLQEIWFINSLWRIRPSSSDVIEPVNQGQDTSSRIFTWILLSSRKGFPRHCPGSVVLRTAVAWALRGCTKGSLSKVVPASHSSFWCHSNGIIPFLFHSNDLFFPHCWPIWGLGWEFVEYFVFLFLFIYFHMHPA